MYYLTCRKWPEEVGNVHVRYLLYGGFHTFLCTLADSLMPMKSYLQQLSLLKYEVNQGYPLQAILYRLVLRVVRSNTQYGPKQNYASRKQQNYTPKSKCHKTLSNLEDAYLFYL